MLGGSAVTVSGGRVIIDTDLLQQVLSGALGPIGSIDFSQYISQAAEFSSALQYMSNYYLQNSASSSCSCTAGLS
jgi:hypothetical protein